MTVESDEDYAAGVRIHPLLHVTAPLVAAGAVWTARLLINVAYRRISGRKPPVPSDPRTSWTRAIGWTAATATTAAVIEVAVHRVANERLPRRRALGPTTA
jgi:hypothetical protein